MPDSPLPKALLIDMDDTLLADREASVRTWAAICQTCALRLGCTTEAFAQALDDARGWYWSDVARHRIGRLDMDRAYLEVMTLALAAFKVNDPAFARRMAQRYIKEKHDSVQIFDGALNTLASLQRHGVRMALVTNGEAKLQRWKIERFGLAPFFDHLQIEGEFGLGKPEPAVYLHALEKLGAKPSDTWMVGDNLEWEVAAPQRLGIAGVWVDWAKRGLPATSPVTPFRIIHSFADIIAIRPIATGLPAVPVT